MDADRVRDLALGLPETAELPHHGFPSFRVRGNVFATWPEPGMLRAMLPATGIAAAVAENPLCCKESWWGKRLAAVAIDLATVDEETLIELLTDAWLGKAPPALAREYRADTDNGRTPEEA